MVSSTKIMDLQDHVGSRETCWSNIFVNSWTDVLKSAPYLPQHQKDDILLGDARSDTCLAIHLKHHWLLNWCKRPIPHSQERWKHWKFPAQKQCLEWSLECDSRPNCGLAYQYCSKATCKSCQDQMFCLPSAIKFHLLLGCHFWFTG